MALKDWKKANKFIYVRKDETEAIIMSQKGFEQKFTFSKSIKDKNTGSYLIKGNLFPYSIKSQALRFAKRYMRTH